MTTRLTDSLPRGLLLEWQAETVEGQQARAAFQDSQNRMQAMARIHEHLYRSQDLARVDMVEYVEELKDYLSQSYGTSGITFKVDAPDVALDVDTAIPCGLIINEVVSNALKYAFPVSWEEKGKITILLHQDNETENELIIQDNGIGIPKDVDIRHTESLGLQLVTILAEDQLNGTVRLERTQGTKYVIRFKRI